MGSRLHTWARERSPISRPAWFHTVSTSLLVTKQNIELEEIGGMNRKGAQPPCLKLKGKKSPRNVGAWLQFNSWQSFLVARCCSQTIIKWMFEPLGWQRNRRRVEPASPNTLQVPRPRPRPAGRRRSFCGPGRRPPASGKAAAVDLEPRGSTAVAGGCKTNKQTNKKLFATGLIQSRCFTESAVWPLAWRGGYSRREAGLWIWRSWCLKINDRDSSFPRQSIHPAPVPHEGSWLWTLGQLSHLRRETCTSSSVQGPGLERDTSRSGNAFG